MISQWVLFMVFSHASGTIATPRVNATPTVIQNLADVQECTRVATVVQEEQRKFGISVKTWCIEVISKR